MTRIVFSRDRPAQLELCLRSLRFKARPEQTVVLWTSTEHEFARGYEKFVQWDETPVSDFNLRLRTLIDGLPDGEKVTFFCDDDVMYRTDPGHDQILDWHPGVLCFSLRLGMENRRRRPQAFPLWDWTKLARTDFGFPGSIDGHTFRKEDLVAMLGGDYIENPTQLETILARRVEMLRGSRPLMASYPLQSIVGVPVNRVSPDSGVPHGLVHPQTTEEMNGRFLAGERIDLEALDFSGVRGCHHEIPYVWRTP